MSSVTKQKKKTNESGGIHRRVCNDERPIGEWV